MKLVPESLNEVLVIDLAHEQELNPDQLVAFAWEYSEKYGTSDSDELEDVEIDLSKSKDLIKDFKYQNRKGHDWREKLIPENLNESMDFERGKDPKKVMGLGRRNQIIKDLEEVNIKESDVEILPDFVILNKKGYNEEKLYPIQLQYMPKKKAAFVENLRDPAGGPGDAIDMALQDGIPPEEIKVLIEEFGKFKEGYQTIDKKTPGIIYLTKITRDEEKIEEEEENNIYAFIGFMGKAPIMVNGKKYYEDKFETEGVIKIDKYDLSSLANISGMKLRTRYVGHGAEVYFVTFPKEFMDEDRYNEIPDKYYDLFMKNKQRI
jgi:hypothetical protein